MQPKPEAISLSTPIPTTRIMLPSWLREAVVCTPRQTLPGCGSNATNTNIGDNARVQLRRKPKGPERGIGFWDEGLGALLNFKTKIANPRYEG